MTIFRSDGYLRASFVKFDYLNQVVEIIFNHKYWLASLTYPYLVIDLNLERGRGM